MFHQCCRLHVISQGVSRQKEVRDEQAAGNVLWKMVWTGLGQRSRGGAQVENPAWKYHVSSFQETLQYLGGGKMMELLIILKTFMQNGLWSLEGELLP